MHVRPFSHYHVGMDPALVKALSAWDLQPVPVPARQLVLLHDGGPRRQAGDPEPSPVQPVEVSGDPVGSLPVATPVPAWPARRGTSPLVWTLAIASILALVFLSSAPL